jgi:hypothetical protein
MSVLKSVLERFLVVVFFFLFPVSPFYSSLEKIKDLFKKTFQYEMIIFLICHLQTKSGKGIRRIQDLCIRGEL